MPISNPSISSKFSGDSGTSGFPLAPGKLCTLKLKPKATYTKGSVHCKCSYYILET